MMRSDHFMARNIGSWLAIADAADADAVLSLVNCSRVELKITSGETNNLEKECK